MIIFGQFLDGNTSKRADARLEVVRGLENTIRLTILDANNRSEIRDFKFCDLTFESRLGNTPREIIIRKKLLFITDDHGQVNELVRLIHTGPKAQDLIHKIESNIIITFVGLFVCGLLSWVGVVYGVPKAASYLAFQMPDFVRNKIGGSLTILDKTLFDPSELSAEDQKRILSLVAPFNEKYPDLNPRLNFRLGMGANAFALPSGDIVFTDDFVNLTESDDELLAVYFHELGHLAHKHMTRRALQAAMLSIGVVLITGDIEHFDFVIGLPALLADLSYSRDFEREADTYAFQAMQDNNIPLKNFANIMQRFDEFYSSKDTDKKGNEGGSWLQYLSTHPGIQERIARATSLSKAEDQ